MRWPTTCSPASRRATLADAIDDGRRADALIAVTPVFTASYSGLFKTFFDVLETRTAGRQAGADRGHRRHGAALAGARARAAAAVRLPPRGRRPDGGLRRYRGLRRTSAGRLDERIDRAAAELASMVAVTAVVPALPRSRSRIASLSRYPSWNLSAGSRRPLSSHLARWWGGRGLVDGEGMNVEDARMGG